MDRQRARRREVGHGPNAVDKRRPKPEQELSEGVYRAADDILPLGRQINGEGGFAHHKECREVAPDRFIFPYAFATLQLKHYESVRKTVGLAEGIPHPEGSRKSQVSRCRRESILSPSWPFHGLPRSFALSSTSRRVVRSR